MVYPLLKSSTPIASAKTPPLGAKAILIFGGRLPFTDDTEELPHDNATIERKTTKM